jgi:DNA-binding transcriptional LysR family regulator
MSANFEYYKVFYYVAKYRNITTAARELSLTQPSVTKVIQNLEVQLGCQLFTRSKKGVALTAEGEMILQRIMSACELLFSAEEEIDQMKFMNSGIVKIGTDDLDIRRDFFLKHCEQFHTLYPNVKIRMIQMDGPELAKSLATGTLDFCITADSSPNPGFAPYGTQYYPDLEIRLIHKYLDIVIVGKEYSFLAEKEITLKELCDYPLIVWAPGTVSREFFEDLFRQRGLQLNASIELVNIEYQILLTEKGFGFSFVPYHCAEEKIRQGTIFPLRLRDCPLQRKLVLMTSRSRPLSFAADRFLELLQNPASAGKV